MKPLVPSILFTTLTLFTSCLDRRNILVKGQITDSISGQPVPNAEVVVLCWYMSNIDDASFKKQSLKTDNSGNYEVAFDKGHKIDVASKARDYQPNRSYNDLIDNQIE